MNAGGALHTSTKVFGDLYPTMLVRLAFRHIQYALVACEHEWVSEEGVRTFATLLKEIDTEATTFLFIFCCSKVLYMEDAPCPSISQKASASWLHAGNVLGH